MENFADLSDEQVAGEITCWAGRIAAGEARLLALIAEFDRREAWAGVGLLSCAQWLSWRVGMGLKAAHERVRVARALGGLPVTAHFFGSGRLSWTQVRAITRVATAADELVYVDLAQHATGAQLEKLVRGVRRARRYAEDAADPDAAANRMRARVHYDADGDLVLTVRAPAERGAMVLAALEQARATLDEQHRSRVDDSSAEESLDPPRRASVADALGYLAQVFLDGQRSARPAVSRRGRSRLVVHVDPLSGWGRLPDGEVLPPQTVCQVLDVSSGGEGLPLRPLGRTDLASHDLGRRRRLPSLALRELLSSLDGERCRFPACTRRRNLHAHHVTYWSCGGRTDLANMVLLCARHHALVHAQGFVLSVHQDRSLTVKTADGIPVPHHPVLPWRPANELDPDGQVHADTLPPQWAGDRLDLRYAVSVLIRQAA